MKNLAIQGHATRGEEVVNVLKMLGGEDKYNIRSANNEIFVYYIRDDNNAIVGKYNRSDNDNVYNIDEFLKNYPYKITDKVTYIDSFGQKNTSTIISMFWDEDLETIMYETEENDIIYTHDIKNVKVEEKPTILDPVIRADMVDFAHAEKDRIELFVGDKFEITQEDGKWFAIRKQPKYPTTYEECCRVINANPCIKLVSSNGQKYSYDADNIELYNNFRRLKICRDAYWKIVGDWKPDWKDTSQSKHSIWFNNEGICTKSNRFSYAVQHILAFPTKEMRDTFYENFKDLIEECKEFL